MRILMVTCEFAPLAKVGGLGDMTAALSGALAAKGHDVRVVLPLYGDMDREAHDVRRFRSQPPFQVRIGQTMQIGHWYRQSAARAGVKIYLVENEALFDRPGVYAGAGGHALADGLTRIAYHNLAALQLPTLLDWSPDVIHCHDATSALAAIYLRRWCRDVPHLGRAGSLLTIHNLAHQEIHPAGSMALLGLPAALAVFPGSFEFYGQINLLKAGILDAGLVNTVSPTYAREVVTDSDLGCGLGGVLEQRGANFSGILNGADGKTWSPGRDPHLVANFTVSRPAGKERCRQALAKDLGLRPGNGPVAGMVTRLVDQKGIDLVLAAVEPMVEAGFSLVVLGTGQEKYEAGLRAAARRYPERVAFRARFDETLAHQIVAGSDLYLMPSRFEPCGLTQMYALRYGSVPLVRHTGGLADTVVDAGAPGGTGFAFREYQSVALLTALRKARALWDDRVAWRQLVRRGMARDFGWGKAAAAYVALYERLAAVASKDRVS